MEKKIERILFDSKKLGWSYNDFVGYLLEVLIVLQERNKVDLQRAPRLIATNAISQSVKATQERAHKELVIVSGE